MSLLEFNFWLVSTNERFTGRSTCSEPNTTIMHTDNSMHLLRTHRTWRMTRYIYIYNSMNRKRLRIEHFLRNWLYLRSLLFRGFDTTYVYLDALKQWIVYGFLTIICVISAYAMSLYNKIYMKIFRVAPVFCQFSFEINIQSQRWSPLEALDKNKLYRTKNEREFLYAYKTAPVELNFPQNNIDEWPRTMQQPQMPPERCKNYFHFSYSTIAITFTSNFNSDNSSKWSNF